MVVYTNEDAGESDPEIFGFERDEKTSHPKYKIEGDEEGNFLMIHRVMIDPKATSGDVWFET